MTESKIQNYRISDIMYFLLNWRLKTKQREFEKIIGTDAKIIKNTKHFHPKF